MKCPNCGETVNQDAVACPKCGFDLTAVQATPESAPVAVTEPAAVSVSPPASNATVTLKPEDVLAEKPVEKPVETPPAEPKRRISWRSRLIFIGGFLLGFLAAPLLGWLILQILVGNNTERKATPPPESEPDLIVEVSRNYMEHAIAQNSDVKNPVITLAPLPVNGAVMTMTMSFKVPLLGTKDVRTVSHIIPDQGKLAVVPQEAGLGENGGIQVPGGAIEKLISEIISNEIDKRINTNPNLQIDVVRVTTGNDRLQVYAALRRAGN